MWERLGQHPEFQTACLLYGRTSTRIDAPKAPARILLDDIMQEIVTNIGFDLDNGLYMYKIEPYPESHHT